MIVLGHITNTIDSLKQNKSRNFLTILGIAIGSACIALVLALARGSEQILLQELAENNDQTIIIKPATIRDSGSWIDFNNNLMSANLFSKTDLQKLAKLKEIKSVNPISPIQAEIKASKNTAKSLVIATTPGFIDTTKIKLDKGQFLQDGIIDNAIVIGQDLAHKLFAKDEIIGEVLKIKNKNFTIIGVISKQIANEKSSGLDFNNIALINYQTGSKLTNNANRITQINVQLKPKVDKTKLKNSIEATILDNHNQDQDFVVLDNQDSRHPAHQTYAKINQIAILIASISIIIGGIGVMNIMLVAVAERTREIGIRRAIGAKTWSIIGQFLVESVILCLIGGLAGFLLAFGVGTFYQSNLPLPISFTFKIALQVIGVAIGAGLIAGLIPAIKASRKNPVNSLREV